LMHEIHKQTRDHHLSANPAERTSSKKNSRSSPTGSENTSGIDAVAGPKLSRSLVAGGSETLKPSCGRLTESNPRRKASLWPQTQTPHSDGNKTMPGPLSGVVVSLSGYQNPERGNMRDAACSLGADYCPDFNDRYLTVERPVPLLISPLLTHVICCSLGLQGEPPRLRVCWKHAQN